MTRLHQFASRVPSRGRAPLFWSTWNGGARAPRLAPVTQLCSRCCRIRSDRRARLRGTERVESKGGWRRFVPGRDPLSAGKDAPSESLRGRRDLKHKSAELFKICRASLLSSPLRVRAVVDQFQFSGPVVLFLDTMWKPGTLLLLSMLSVSGELQQETESRRLPPPGKLDFGYVPAGVYETLAHYEPGPIGILFQLVHAFLHAVQPNAFPHGESSTTQLRNNI